MGSPESVDPAIVSVDRVTKRFGGVVALQSVSLSIMPGEVHAIVGENGAGKSTLMKILSGVITDYEGQIRLRGQTVRFSGTREAERAGISIIHQELNLVEELAVAANIFLGREPRNRWGLLNDRQMRRDAQQLFERVGTPIHPDRLVKHLRVGDRQLVEIVKALSLQAEIVIMDEPTSALSQMEVHRLFGIIDSLRSRRVTILYISHKMDEVFRIADRITVLRDGRLAATLPRDRTNPDEITRLMVGRELMSLHWDEPRRPDREVLLVEGLSLPWHQHPGKWRLKDVSFSLRRGEIVGVAGLMGAGRTELLESLFGASPLPPQGHIFLDGHPVHFRHPNEAVAAGLGLVTEDRARLGLFDNLSVGANISLCRLSAASLAGVVLADREQQMVSQAIGQWSIRTPGSDVPITTLSGGNQQKCILARWLLTQPKVLLLDDPTRGVDVGAKAEMYRLMDQLCRQGLGILFTSSELPELLAVCDRILVLCEGRLTAELSRAEATEERIMQAATQRESS